ncbi:TPA: phage tail protein [Escherichia coli]
MTEKANSTRALIMALPEAQKYPTLAENLANNGASLTEARTVLTAKAESDKQRIEGIKALPLASKYPEFTSKLIECDSEAMTVTYAQTLLATVDAQAMMQEKKTAFLFDAYMEKHSPKCVGPVKEQVETLADNVQQNTNAVEENTQRVEQLASQVEDTAEEVRQNAEAAKQAASDAEQARDDIDVALSATLKTANHLSEIAAEGEDAQQESRDNLGLKSAATMDVQTDIYNRTEGCVALPGAFGYGAYPTQRKEFDKYATSATFASWVQTTPPGRYLVVQYGGPYSKDIIEGVVFSGEVEIKMLETATHENQNRRDKFVIFNGVNQDVYCCEVRAGSTNIRWTCLSQNLTAIDGARWLYSIAGPWYDVPFRDVAVGGLTQAAYRAANTDEYTIKRGDSVSGSTLIPCAVIVSNNGAPRYVLDTGRHFSGSYVSLGNSTQATSDFIFGLFVRVS